ncbi:MAG TPA: PAS domain S-box protein [Gemmatimonadota bacterium]|nr:PAS domain S-box protein [Gemmatimonadota bacterium]
MTDFGHRKEPSGSLRLRWFDRRWLPFLVVLVGLAVSLLLWRTGNPPPYESLQLWILVGGILVTFLAAFALHAMQTADRGAQILAAERDQWSGAEAVHAALRKSEKVFRSIFENSSVGMARTDPQGRFLLANNAYQEMLGYTMEELESLTLESVTHPDDWTSHRKLFQRMISGEIPAFEIQKRYVRKDGSEFWVLASDSAVFGEDGKLLFAQAITRNINDIKAAELALRESEAELADAQAIAHVGSWIWDIDEDEVHWSDELYRIYGMEPGTPLDYAGYLSRIVPEERARTDEIVREAYRTAKPFDFLQQIVRPNGEVRTVHARGRVVRDESGRAIRMLGTGQDVTEAVQVERALRQSGESYRLLAENVQEMIMRFTPQGRILYASPAARTILGYDPADVVGREGEEFLHPGDLDRVVDAHKQLLRGVEPPAVLCRLLHRAGHHVWMETTTRGVWDPKTGEVESIIAVSRDVTESVQAARISRLLHAVAVSANEAASVKEAMQTALRLVSEHAGWPVGHAFVPARSALGDAGPLDIWHVEDPARHVRLREFMGTPAASAGQGVLSRVLENGNAEWVRDVTVDPGFVRAGMARELGVRAAFAFPIRSGNNTIAVLEFFAEQPGEPDAGVVDLLDSVGAQLGEVLRRKQAEQALRASEERFRALAESANDAFVTVDGRGIVVHCNPSLQRIFGYSCAEICGKPLNRLLANPQPNGQASSFQHFLDCGEHLTGRTIEVTGRRKDGEELPLEMSLATWETNEGSFVTGILRDITARKQAEESLAEKMEELARSNSELALFTYMASHDLREPLRTVGSNLQLLGKRIVDEADLDTGRQFDFAMSGVRRMQSLIDDLLVYSRVGTEGKPFEIVESTDVVREATKALSVAIEESEGAVEVGSLPRVRGDRSQLVQLFQNLLSNAIKFRGDSPPRVEVAAERNGDSWVFTVRDHGIGIDPEYSEDIFTIFHRLHSVEEYPGTGIGLAVCRKIVERHGGRIWMDPEPEGGSSFRFTLSTRGA